MKAAAKTRGAPARRRTDPSASLQTDLYQITMAAAYFINRIQPRASFELYVKNLPPQRSYLVSAGLEQVVEYLGDFRFSHDDVEFLRTLPNFAGIPDEFFGYLKELRFTGDVWGLPEGTPFFEKEPILRVTAPIVEAQLVESHLLNIVNYQVTVASKASRILTAAAGREIVDFGFRRAPSPQAAAYASRAAYIAGFDATSNLECGRRFGIPVIGTVPYSFVLAFPSEQDALKQYARAFPEEALVLIDTFNPQEATRQVIACGEKLRGVRISAGDLLDVSREVRRILDGANHKDTQIVASGELNEEKIAGLVRDRAPIDSYGIGAALVANTDCSLVEGVYRLVEIEEKSGVRFPFKFSPGKETIPGKKQVVRRRDGRGTYVADVIIRAGEVPCDGESPCLARVMEGGKPVLAPPPLKDVRNRCLAELACLPPAVRRIDAPERYPVEISPRLLDITGQ